MVKDLNYTHTVQNRRSLPAVTHNKQVRVKVEVRNNQRLQIQTPTDDLSRSLKICLFLILYLNDYFTTNSTATLHF